MKKITWLATFIMLLNVAYAQQVIPLYPTGQIPNAKATEVAEIIDTFPAGDKTIRFVVNISIPELTAYLPTKEKANGMAVIICPGGGYSGVAIDHEGHDMAKKMSENGIAGFVLKYRMPQSAIVDNKEFVPLQDAQRALQIVRENAREWGIDPRKVGIAGSSAGGHLASTAGTHYHKTLIGNPKNTSLRPDFMILNYPVISFADSLTHYGSRSNLLGDMPISEEKKREYSNELHVTPDTPPAFVTHAVDDEVVKVQNAILFIAALQKNKVPVETFFYAKGGHGYGMDNPTTDVDWIDNCINWLLKFRN